MLEWVYNVWCVIVVVDKGCIEEFVIESKVGFCLERGFNGIYWKVCVLIICYVGSLLVRFFYVFI